MTRAEVEILLKSVYKGEGATKALSDLDKISASGSKLEGVLKGVNKTMGGNILGAKGGSAAFRRLNPHLFPSPATGGIAPPGSVPPIPPANLPSLPSSSPGGGGGAAGVGLSGLLSKFASRLFSRALSITAGLLVYKALNIPLQALSKTIKGLNDAIERARKLYTGALTSGLGLQFSTKRTLLAQVLGVSEKDVFQFGAAIQFINPQLEHATYNLSKTAPSLAGLSFQFKILEQNMASIFATLANEAAPALSTFADGMTKFLIAFDKFLQHDPIAKLIQEMGKEAFLGPLEQIGKLLGGADKGAAPNPVAYMQQTHASALEHMGLIVGGLGGATDFAAQTAQNTKKTADAVVKIAQKMTGSRGSFGDNLGVHLNSVP